MVAAAAVHPEVTAEAVAAVHPEEAIAEAVAVVHPEDHPEAVAVLPAVEEEDNNKKSVSRGNAFFYCKIEQLSN